MITIIVVGKKHEDWVSTGIERYEKRLRAPFNIEWILLPHSSLEGTQARQEESERIHKRLTSDTYILLLDERGKKFNSVAFSELLEEQSIHSQNLIVIIGGAYGVSDDLHQRANSVLSLSDMVFPHQLVRLILIEQIYRAQSIVTGSKYHHL